MTVKIVTDSAADLPPDVASEMDVTVVPLTVRFGNSEYVEGRDISTEEFYAKLAASPDLPKTAQPSPAAFARAFAEADARSDGDGVLCLTISSALSGTYQSALLGLQMAKRLVRVVDSKVASLATGTLVVRAFEAAREGMKLEALSAMIGKCRDEITVLVALETLENLVKGGRLGHVQGFVAQLLNFKAILHNVDGRPVPLERVRGSRRLLERLVELAAERGHDLATRIVGISHADNLAAAFELRDRLLGQVNARRVIVGSMGSTLGTYAGKGGIILSF